MWEEGDKSAIKKLDWKMKSMKFNVIQRQTSETFFNLELTQPSSMNLITMGNKKNVPVLAEIQNMHYLNNYLPKQFKIIRSKTPSMHFAVTLGKNSFKIQHKMLSLNKAFSIDECSER